MRDNVARLRQLLQEAVPEKPASTAELFSLDQTPRARLEREVTRIATLYGWQAEVVHFLDRHEALGLIALSIEQLELLQQRMRKLEECLLEGFDHPDCAPAR